MEIAGLAQRNLAMQLTLLYIIDQKHLLNLAMQLTLFYIIDQKHLLF